MIKVKLDLVMAQRGVNLSELADIVGITPSNLSRFKCGRTHGVRFDTLSAICQALHCRVEDVLEYVEE